MDKIQRLVELAYNTGYHSCRLEHPKGLSDNEIDDLRIRLGKEIESRRKLALEIRSDIHTLVGICLHILAADGDYPTLDDWQIHQNQLRDAVSAFHDS